MIAIVRRPSLVPRLLGWLLSTSDYLANKINDHLWSRTTYTAPATVYAQLYSSNPGATNTGTQIAIARAAITNNATNFPASSARSKTNGLKISWGTTVGVTGLATATHVGFLDAATAGNLLEYGALAVGINPNDSAEVAIQPGQLTITR